MNREVLREWVSALRSGEYAQGQSHLHNETDNAYCCLGVLSELAVKAGVIPPPVSCPIGDDVVLSSFYGGYTEMPPPEVYEWVGVATGELHLKQPLTLNGRHVSDLTYTKLANMNDDGESFADIADAIEKAWIEKDASNA